MNTNMLYYNTRLSKISDKDLLKILSIAVEYCSDNMGVNRRKKNKLRVFLGEYNREENAIVNPNGQKSYPILYGSYVDSHKIELYINEIPNLGEFTRTLIHEWAHSLQPCRSKYDRMFIDYGYNNHPFEIEARKMEDLHNRNLLKFIRNKLKD